MAESGACIMAGCNAPTGSLTHFFRDFALNFKR